MSNLSIVAYSIRLTQSYLISDTIEDAIKIIYVHMSNAITYKRLLHTKHASKQ